MRAAAPFLVLVLTACGGLAPVSESVPPGNCQIRYGAAVTEGSGATGFADLAADARGAAMTKIGNCGDKLHSGSVSGASFVCYGDPAVCAAWLESRPIPIPADELRDLRERAAGNGTAEP